VLFFMKKTCELPDLQLVTDETVLEQQLLLQLEILLTCVLTVIGLSGQTLLSPLILTESGQVGVVSQLSVTILLLPQVVL